MKLTALSDPLPLDDAARRDKTLSLLDSEGCNMDVLETYTPETVQAAYLYREHVEKGIRNVAAACVGFMGWEGCEGLCERVGHGLGKAAACGRGVSKLSPYRPCRATPICRNVLRGLELPRCPRGASPPLIAASTPPRAPAPSYAVCCPCLWPSLEQARLRHLSL